MTNIRTCLLLAMTILAVSVAPHSYADSLVTLKIAGFSSWDEPMEVPFSSWDEPMEVPLTSVRTNNFITRLELRHKVSALAGKGMSSRRGKKGRRKLPNGKVKIECSSCSKKTVHKLSRKTAELVNCAYYCKALTRVSNKGFDIKLETQSSCSKCNKKDGQGISARYRFAGQKSYRAVKVNQNLLRALVLVVHGKGNSVPKSLLKKIQTIFKL